MFRLLTTLLATSAALLLAVAQGDLTSANNVTSLQGTWSSGSGNVLTGNVSLLVFPVSGRGGEEATSDDDDDWR